MCVCVLVYVCVHVTLTAHASDVPLVSMLLFVSLLSVSQLEL